MPDLRYAITVPLAFFGISTFLGKLSVGGLRGSGLFARSAPLALHHRANLSNGRELMRDFSKTNIDSAALSKRFDFEQQFS